jgi:hypothetical protein
MKKYVLFYLTGLTAIWFLDSILTGFKLANIGSALLLGLFISFTIWITEYIVQQLTQSSMLIFVIIGAVISFFALYIASILVPGFSVVRGTLNFLVTAKSLDTIITLLISAGVVMAIAYLTNWATVE